MQWSILWQWFLKFQFKVSPQCNWNKRSVAMYPPSLNITYLNKWAVFQICFVVFPFLTQLNLWVQKRRQVVYKFMFHQLNLLVRLISLNFKTNKKTWRVIFSFLILVASCVCIPLNIPYLYTNGLPPPLQPCMGQHLHFERNLEKLKEPTNILETFEKKRKFECWKSTTEGIEHWKWQLKLILNWKLSFVDPDLDRRDPVYFLGAWLSRKMISW